MEMRSTFLILVDDPAFVGCILPATLMGVIDAEQTERLIRRLLAEDEGSNHTGPCGYSLDQSGSENLEGEWPSSAFIRVARSA